MSHYVQSEYHFWSPVLGARAVRLSLFDERGSEFFVVAARPQSGQSYREWRDKNVTRMMAAIRMGREPGEMKEIGNG